MGKIARNAPCHCGSGKKYKKCCLPSEQDAAAEAAKEKQQQRADDRAAMAEGAWGPETAFFDEEDLIDDYSNQVVDLINDGDLDGAEQACKVLEAKFPDFIDCPDRRAMLCEACGEIEQAIAYNERCLEIIAKAPKGWYGTAPIYETAIARLRGKIAAAMPGEKLAGESS